ncbi:MAG: phosphoglucosamine mutase [Dehalococcoidia bacterium]|nr:phosphoglucosamine mutase [Dehalococcoidia bacterium]
MSLFGTSGVRGVFGNDLTLDLCYDVAQSLGTLLPAGAKVCVATDSRISGPAIKEAVISGLCNCGADAADLGMLPTPALALLTRELGFDTGVMITASHNPPEFNGIKLFNANAMGYSRDQEQKIEAIYSARSFRRGSRGSASAAERTRQAYLQAVRDKLPHSRINRRLKIVVDPGNGAASGFASWVFAELGLTVLPINDKADGRFPGRNPEPKEDTLRETLDFLRRSQADLAVCFDGDADRVVFCDRDGFLGFNEPIAFISRLAVLESGQKAVATTVETGRLLDLATEDLGVKVYRGRVGDADVAHLARETNAAIGVEQVGVYIIPQIGYYPDSMFAALTLLCHISDPSEIRAFFQRIPSLFFDKGKVSCPNEGKAALMRNVAHKAADLGAASVSTLDGVRLEFGDSWMLIRASGTEPVIRVLAESPSASATADLIDRGVKLVESLLSGSER